MVELLNWTITPWLMNGKGGWVGIAPVILVEGELPFTADHPAAYIDKLQALHDDPRLTRGQFYTYMGQLRDALEQNWNREAINGTDGVDPNSDRVGGKRN